MNYRETIIEDDKTLDDSGTVTIPLNVVDPITELLLRFRVANDADPSIDNPPEIALTKIEITDGGKTYMSMTGYEAVAAACYDKGFWPPHWYCEVNGTSQRIAIPLQFGRYLGDPDFAFDPTKLQNPALKVTFAKDAEHLADSLRLGVGAKIMEGVPGPAKCLLYRGVETFNSAGAGIHVVDLLTDYPYRRLLVRAYGQDAQPYNIITHHKLDCDVGRLIVFDHDSAEWEDLLRGFFGPFQVRKYDRLVITTNYRQCHISGRTVAVPTTEGYNLTAATWATGSLMYQGAIYNASTDAMTIGNIQVLITGDFPHSTYCYQFGHRDKPDTWFRASQFKDIDLKLSDGVADCSVAVILQQPVPLP